MKGTVCEALHCGVNGGDAPAAAPLEPCLWVEQPPANGRQEHWVHSMTGEISYDPPMDWLLDQERRIDNAGYGMYAASANVGSAAAAAAEAQADAVAEAQAEARAHASAIAASNAAAAAATDGAAGKGKGKGKRAAATTATKKKPVNAYAALLGDDDHEEEEASESDDDAGPAHQFSLIVPVHPRPFLCLLVLIAYPQHTRGPQSPPWPYTRSFLSFRASRFVPAT